MQWVNKKASEPAMKFNINFPVNFRALPKRSKEWRNIMVSEAVDADLREASSADMPVVFETHQSWHHGQEQGGGGGGFLGQRTTHETLRDDHRVIRTMNGRLYRMIAPTLESEREAGLFGRALQVKLEGSFEDINIDLSAPLESLDVRYTRLKSHPAAHEMYREMIWQQRRLKVEGDPAFYLWPEPTSAVRQVLGRDGDRNSLVLSAVNHRLVEADYAGVLRSYEMRDRQIEKLVVMDGESIWMECPPPVFMVKRHFTDMMQTSLITLTHAPNWSETELDKQWFSINDRAAAEEYAEDMIGAFRASNPEAGRLPRIDKTVAMTIHDDALLEFDHKSEELRRMSHAAVIDNRRFLCAHPDMTKWSDETKAMVLADFDETAKTSYFDGEYADLSPRLVQNLEAWKAIRFQASVYSAYDARLRDMLIGRALEIESHRPVDVASALTWTELT
jgi:hypothetical protein